LDVAFLSVVSSVSVFGPLVRLSPPPSEKDYFFNLGDSEGICDLFDVPMISMWSLKKEVKDGFVRRFQRRNLLHLNNILCF